MLVTPLCNHVALSTAGGTETACDGTDFKIVWNASGIFTFTVA
tara:strand:- start:1055 stop:1183 length:129 start_codon:yes stop_codon:yes gene_type:complete